LQSNAAKNNNLNNTTNKCITMRREGSKIVGKVNMEQAKWNK